MQVICDQNDYQWSVSFIEGDESILPSVMMVAGQGELRGQGKSET